MFDSITEILAAHTEYPRAQMTETTTIAGDLCLSSYDVMCIVGEFEDRFDIEISDKDIKQIQTIGDIQRCIEKK